MNKRPVLGISMGDPGGIGPEICVKALDNEEIYAICRPCIIGDASIVADAVTFCGLDLKVLPCADISAGRYTHKTIDVYDLKNMPLSELKHKQVSAAQGKAAFEYVTTLIDLAMRGQVEATVTAPINKASINAAGYHYAGHTEIFADKTNTRDYAMMLADGDFRVVHVSTHLSLREACDRVSKQRILKVIQLTDQTLKQLGIAESRIGVAGLNPHCGEEGLFGFEDDRETRPAVEEALAQGIHAEGPIPADTVFSKMKGGFFDAVVVMYHDQGHIPMKLLGFSFDRKTGQWGHMAGVNVTLGLPIIRTSVDHGTAFGKAGEARANPQSMLEAIKMAALMAGTRP
ncbi:MAG: 4-hydroxythreonine-4-phosphate dehydrogenase PdxA [Desulfohalobiaceae bacterium]|nr:4-hydroxythreonine-4-phosphate dehydrogenase PdxA [Desulfohalobiaceae bacterium]